jgi:hypothetical protein
MRHKLDEQASIDGTIIPAGGNFTTVHVHIFVAIIGKPELIHRRAPEISQNIARCQGQRALMDYSDPLAIGHTRAPLYRLCPSCVKRHLHLLEVFASAGVIP